MEKHNTNFLKENKRSDTSIYHLIHRLATFGNPRTGAKVSVTSCSCEHNIGARAVSSTDMLILKEVQNPGILSQAAALQWMTLHQNDIFEGYPKIKGIRICYANTQTDPFLKQVLKSYCIRNHYLLPRRPPECFSHTVSHSL